MNAAKINKGRTHSYFIRFELYFVPAFLENPDEQVWFRTAVPVGEVGGLIVH